MTGQTQWIDLIIPTWILAITSFSRAKVTAIDAYPYQRNLCLLRKILTVELYYSRMHLRVRKTWSKWLSQEDAMKIIQQILPNSLGCMNLSAPDLVAISLSVKRGARSRRIPAMLPYTRIKLILFSVTQNANIG